MQIYEIRKRGTDGTSGTGEIAFDLVTNFLIFSRIRL